MPKRLIIFLICLASVLSLQGTASAKLYYSLYATAGEHTFANEQDLSSDPLTGLKLSLDFEERKSALDFSLEGTLNSFTTTNQSDNTTADTTVARLDVLYPLMKKPKWKPFLTVGIGRIIFDGGVTRPEDEDIVSYGGGLKYLLTEYLTLRVDARHELYFNRDAGNIDNYEYTASIGYTFGKRKPKPKPKVEPKPKQEAPPEPPPEPKVTDDDDEDGVKNPVDRCPGTPPGIQVDETGCAIITEGALPEPEPTIEEVPVTPEPEPAPPVEEPEPEPAPPVPAEPIIEPEDPSVGDLFGEGATKGLQPEYYELPPRPKPVAQPLIIAITDQSSGEIKLPDPGENAGAAVAIPECSGQLPSNLKPVDSAESAASPEKASADTIQHAPAASFKIGTAELSAQAKKILDHLMHQLQNSEREYRIRVEGHTDSTGSESYNKALSLRRAQAVANYLTEETGFDLNNVSAVGCGEWVPLTSNETEIGRKMNRRFELIIMPLPKQP